MQLQLQKLRVLNDNILLEGIKPERRGGVVRGVSSDDKPELGRVISCGIGKTMDNGSLKPMEVKPGDIVLFNQHTTTKFNFDGTDLFIIKEEDVIGYQSK